MTQEPFFNADDRTGPRYRWRYAGDVLRLTDIENAAIELHGELAGRVADLLQRLALESREMEPVLAAIWLTAAAGSAGLVVPCLEGPSVADDARDLRPASKGGDDA